MFVSVLKVFSIHVGEMSGLINGPNGKTLKRLMKLCGANLTLNDDRVLLINGSRQSVGATFKALIPIFESKVS